jgi:hypothetical protein
LDNWREAVRQRALASALLSAAASRQDLAMLRSTAQEFQDEPELEMVYRVVQQTSPIELPSLQTLLDPLYEPGVDLVV